MVSLEHEIAEIYLPYIDEGAVQVMNEIGTGIIYYAILWAMIVD